MARASPNTFARGYSPLAGEVRRAASASPLITPPRVEIASVLSGGGPALASSSLVSSAVPPLGSGLSDLRATVVAQQRQLDGLVDKVASLLSAMHAESHVDARALAKVLEDVRKSTRHGDNVVAPPAPKDYVHFVDLRETEGGLRSWMQGQLRETWDMLEAKMRDLQFHVSRVSNEVRDVHHVTNEVHSMRAKISHLEEEMSFDDEETAELRNHLEERLEAQTAHVHASMGQLAAELRQQFQGASSEHLQEELRQRVDLRLQEHESKDGILGKLRDDLRQEAEVRLEAKMTQTFGLAQRLMNELRQELQSQVVQVHEASQHLAVELRRGLEAQQLHLQASLQHIMREGGGRGPAPAAAESSAAVEEQLAGCRAAAADCARCAVEAAEATDNMEAQMETTVQRLADELREELQKAQQELKRTAAASKGGDNGAAAVAELEQQLAQVQSQLADSVQASKTAAARTSSLETGLQELSQRLPSELRRDSEAREERLARSLQQQVQQAVQSMGEVHGSGGGDSVTAIAAELEKVRAEARSKAEAVETGLQELSSRLSREAPPRGEPTAGGADRFGELSARLSSLRGELESQESRVSKSLQQYLAEEVQKVQKGAPSESLIEETEGRAAVAASAAEAHLAGCKTAAVECQRCIEETSSRMQKAEAKLRACGEELSERLGQEGSKLLAGLAEAKPATAAKAADEAVPGLEEVVQRLAELEEEVGSHRRLLMALRERIIQADGSPDEGYEESRSSRARSSRAGSHSGQSPVGVTNVRGGMSPRSASRSSDDFES